MATVPKTVYKTPNPQKNVSELYTVFAEQLPEATDPKKRWVVKKRYGAWDEASQKFEINVRTLGPTDPKHCVTIEEAHAQVDQQIQFRAKSGFKYLFVRDFFDAPWFKRYEIQPDGREKPMD
jgi:hypothetical protein